MTADHPFITRDWQVRAAVEGRLSVLVVPIKDQSTVRDRDGGEVWTGFMGWQTVEWVLDNPGACAKPCLPPMLVGRRYWCREAWRTPTSFNGNAADMAAGAKEAGYPRPWAPIRYEADGARDNWELAEYVPGRLRPASQMPRWATRLTAIPTSVRVARFQDVTEAEALADGARRYVRQDLASLWDRQYGGYTWGRNPWCTIATVSVHHRNIESMEANRG